MKLTEQGQRLTLEHLPKFEWVRAGLFMAAGLIGLATFGPQWSAAPVMAVMLPVLVSGVMVGGSIWLALRSRGDRVVLDAGSMTASIRSVGLLPDRRGCKLGLRDIEAVEVDVANIRGGGVRWQPSLRVAGDTVPLLGGWLEERAECEQAVSELRAWLAAHGAPAAARAAAPERGPASGKSTRKSKSKNKRSG